MYVTVNRSLLLREGLLCWRCRCRMRSHCHFVRHCARHSASTWKSQTGSGDMKESQRGYSLQALHDSQCSRNNCWCIINCLKGRIRDVVVHSSWTFWKAYFLHLCESRISIRAQAKLCISTSEFLLRRSMEKFIHSEELVSLLSNMLELKVWIESGSLAIPVNLTADTTSKSFPLCYEEYFSSPLTEVTVSFM